MTMDQSLEFVTRIREQFTMVEGEPPLDMDSDFKSYPSWDSLTALLVLDMIDDNYQREVSADDLRTCETVGDLYDLVRQKTP